MMDTIKTLSLMIILGAAARFASEWLDSPYLMKFLDANLINLQIALLAINTTTAGVVLSRMREIIERTGANFDLTILSFKRSTAEQVFLAIASIVLLTAINSSVLIGFSAYAKPIFECLLVSVFFSSLYNLYDNAKAIFIIINYKG
jgi:hypothetical protein